MVEQYAAQQLSVPTPATDWKLWGQSLLAIDVFSNEAVPNPAQYRDWQDWAFALLGAINPGIPA